MTLELDNTRIGDFKHCPRYYYFRHVRHWVPAGMNSPAIVFGTCWSLALDALWQGASVADAMQGFMAGWYGEGLTWPLPLAYQKRWGHHNPETAKKMLGFYAAKRERFIKDVEVLSVDKGIKFPIYKDVDYVAKPDKIVKHDGEVSIIDHKTTGYGGKEGFTFSWSEQWHLSSQIDGYRWLVSKVYNQATTKLWIDAALVSKLHHHVFELLPIRKGEDWQVEWLEDTHYWVDRIKAKRYPKNTGSCRAFNRLCEYFDICRWHSNPEELDTPKDFVVRKWDPLT